MQDAAANEFEEDEEWVLELVVHFAELERGAHRAAERGVDVRVHEEPVGKF